MLFPPSLTYTLGASAQCDEGIIIILAYAIPFRESTLGRGCIVSGTCGVSVASSVCLLLWWKRFLRVCLACCRIQATPNSDSFLPLAKDCQRLPRILAATTFPAVIRKPYICELATSQTYTFF